MSITTLPLLRDLQGVWSGLRVERIEDDTGAPTPMTLENLYSFSSVTDLKRQLWIQMDGNPRWAPEHVFLGMRQSDGSLRPLEFHWPADVGVTLPDPLNPSARTPSQGLVDEAGNRKPVQPTLLGSLVLEVAMVPEMMGAAPAAPPPTVTAICLSAIAPKAAAQLTTPLFTGFYQLYFPWLTAPAQVLTPTTDFREEYAAAVPYMFDRSRRITMVQDALRAGHGGELVKMNTMVRMRWILPPPAQRPDSLERTFYGLRATPTMPFLRYFPPTGKGAPILKLGLNEDGSMILNDAKVLTHYLNQVAPPTSGGVIMGRIPIVSTHVERGAAFTLYMFADGTSDITFEVPQRGMAYIATVAAIAERMLTAVIREMGFPADTQLLLRDLHATYSWTHPSPMTADPISIATLQSRVSALTPFFDVVPLTSAEVALGVFIWRATSNYESESAQYAYITQLLMKNEPSSGDMSTMLAGFVTDLAHKFGITEEQAGATLDNWYKRRSAAVAPVTGIGAGTLAVPKHNTGTQIVIRGAHPEYRMEIQGVDNYMELQRVVSVVGVLLGTPEEGLDLRRPSSAMAGIAQQVALADVQVEQGVSTAAAQAGAEPETEDDIDGIGMNPDLADLLGELYGGEYAQMESGIVEEVATGEEAGAATGAAEGTATVEEAGAATGAAPEKCRGVPWRPDEPALKINDKYYITKLTEKDTVLFAYKIPQGETGSKKSYSRSCQAGDGRQPNIMSQAEYTRVQSCYEGRVRFVNLPPKSPADLPSFPGYNPKKQIPDEAFFTDPETGLPMWAVLETENRTRLGTFNYLMCADLWCDRDNMPLLRSEFAGTQGRGFEKSPNTCPFCGGGIVEDLKNPRSGESVVARKPKKATEKLHIFVGELTRDIAHPAGYNLPCCDTTPRMIREYLEKAYTGDLTFGAAAAAEEEKTIPAPSTKETETAGEEQRVEYEKILGSMKTQYILGADKTLGPGKIGLLPPYLDAFFGQNSQQATETRLVRRTFIDGTVLFVRVGVDSRLSPPQPGLNLFAGLAPLLGFDSAEKVQRHILTRPMARAFESANYGTLVQEFAARSTLTDTDIAASLQAFATEYSYSLNASNRGHIARLYKAWNTFRSYLSDYKEPKRLRHIEHLLAQPGVIMPQGLLLVVLEREGDTVRVVCPSFGIPKASYFADVPIAFLWRDPRLDTWEPIVLYNGTKQAVKFFGGRSPELDRLPPQMRMSIHQWIVDWRSSSIGCGRPEPPPHVWTPDRDTSGLPRLSTLLSRTKGYRVTALVRDRSNRLAGVLMSEPISTAAAATGAAAPATFFLPTLDDGALADSFPRVFEAESIPAEPLDSYLRFYEKVAEEYPTLRPDKILAHMDTAPPIVVGFKTTAGVMIPVEASPIPASHVLPIQQIDMFPWERDVLILRAPDSGARNAEAIEESIASVEDQMSEAYQHLRVSMAQWLRSDPTATAFKEDLATLLVSQLPLYERRKRMDIRLEPLIRSWLIPEQTEEKRLLPMLRENCIALTGEAECRAVGACRWSGERCLIHAPYRQEGTDPVRIFTARMSDELLRYATQRRELYDNSVPMIRTPRGVVRQGNELYIAAKPKESATGLLERLGIMARVSLSFPEEMLRFEGLEEDEAPTVEAPVQLTVIDVEALPVSWTAMGLQIPSFASDLPDARRMAWSAERTGYSLEDWTKFIRNRRQKLGVPGDPARPFEWTIQDFYIISAITRSNQLFVRTGSDGRLILDRWIAPPRSAANTDKPVYTILWGPRQLLVTKGATSVYRFTRDQIPEDLLALLAGSQPMSSDAAREAVGVSAEIVPTKTGGEIPQPAATQGQGDGGATPAPQSAPTI